MVTPSASLLQTTLRLGDSALVLGHRISEWCGHAPMLEEDIALANLGLDLIGQAELLLTYAGEIEAKGRDADQLAYFRDAHDYRNDLIVEQPNGDFAATIVRHLLFAAFVHPYFDMMARSSDQRLAGIAGKAVKEMAYHVRHASEWTIRLGDGTAESHARAAEAFDDLWMYTGELFEMGNDEAELAEAGVVPDRGALRPVWDRTLSRVLDEATLERPADRWMQSGGRIGRHSEHLGHMLAEMQFLQRAYPGATW